MGNFEIFLQASGQHREPASSASAYWQMFADALHSPHYRVAQDRVLRQLLEALLFEQVLAPEMRPQGADLVCFDIPAQTVEGAPVLYRCHGRISASFGRIRLDASPLLRIFEDEQREVASVREFLLEAGAATTVDQVLLQRFLREVEQTLLKDTLALHARRPDLGVRDLTALEGQLQDGHPYHPCYKSRVGFDPLDNYAYGPEFQPPVHLFWLGLKRSCATLAHCADIDMDEFMRQEIGAAQHARFLCKLRNRGLNPQDYLLLPAHPWQWREKLAPELFPLLQSQDLVWLGEGEDECRPLQSIRSLANFSKPFAAQVKLPLGIVNTSADRILSCHNVENAPAVSHWLSGIVARDPILRACGLIVLREVAGITYRDTSLPLSLQAQQYGMLGVVWRENIQRLLAAGEDAAPFSGLCQCEADGRPFIAPWLERFGLAAWLDALLEASLPPLVHLLYAHGIGMEAHAQNLVLVHRQGLPCRIALKDLPGGLRFARACLADPQHCPTLVPPPAFRKQVNATAGMEVMAPDAVRDYFHDAVFFINFDQLAFFLQRHYGLHENDFWARVAACILAYQARHPALAARFASFDLFAPTILVEQLAKRRLFAETEARLQAVPNPLHRHRNPSGTAA